MHQNRNAPQAFTNYRMEETTDMPENRYQKSLLFTPEGVRDIYGEDCEKRYKIQNSIHTIMKLYGFKDIQTPTFEFFDIFSHEKGTVTSREMFKFFNQYNNTLVLRKETTTGCRK